MADNAAVVQSGRITEAVDDVALAVESAWRRFLVAEPASEPGEPGLPADSSRGDALSALHRMRAVLHGVFGVDETRRAQLCLWPTAAPDDNLHHHAVAGEDEDTIECLCGGPLIDGGERQGASLLRTLTPRRPVVCVRSGTVIWSPQQPNREPDVERAATAEERLIGIPYEYLGPDGRTLVDNPRDQRPDDIGI